MPTDLIRRLLFWSALPLAAPQGLWLRRTTPRLPAAAGAEAGRVGAGPPLHVLALGDSVIAGVGAVISEAALPACFAAELAQRLHRTVHWRTLARVGADAACVRHRLLPQLGTGDVDLVLLSVGVNDVAGLRTRAAFRADLLGLLEALRSHSPRCRIVLAGVPPLQHFPRLPQPLRFLFGQRSRSLDRVMREVARHRPNVLHVRCLQPAPQRFATDGYHPNAKGHAEWAERLARLCVGHWTYWRTASRG